MRLAQEKELINIESAQKLQFAEFSEAWDQYMRDYEATLQNQIERAMRGTDIFMGPSIKGSGRSAGISENQWMRRNVEG